VRHLRRMATAKTTFVIVVPPNLERPPCATDEDPREKARRLQYSIHAGSAPDWVSYSAPLADHSQTALADDKQTASAVVSARCFPNLDGLITLLHIARIALESQMAKDAPA